MQQYDSWGTDGQRLVLKDAGKGNVKLTMKANNNKCVGPKGHALVAGTKLEVQDCNGGNDQAWITGETAAGSGIFMLKNVAAPGLCVDVDRREHRQRRRDGHLHLHGRHQPAVRRAAAVSVQAERGSFEGRSAHADRPFSFGRGLGGAPIVFE